MTIASLGIEVRSEQATGAAVDLDRLTASAGRAHTATRSLSGATGQADTATGQLTRALAGEEASLQAVGRAADIAAAATGKVHIATLKGAGAMQAGSLNVANLAAQFQDVAITSAMAMNPIQIALQQGTQISAVLGPMGAAGAVKALGAAFVSVLSPVSLVTIGIVALSAAGLQMVDWTSVAKGALNFLADALVPIAPYAVAAAGGLALFYSPAIIGGIASVTMSLVGLARQAVITGVALLAANPVGALALGFAAAVTAAVIFRDELAKLIGRDVVQDVINAGNKIIGVFVGAYEAVKATWSALPAAIGDLVYSAAQNAVNGVIYLVRNVQIAINGFLADIDKALLSMGGKPLGMNVGIADFVSIDNPYAGAAGSAASTASDAFGSAMSRDYIGEGIKAIQHGASSAADALRKLAGGMGESTEGSKKAAKEAKRQADAYDDIVRSAEQRIEQFDLERESIGMTAEETARLRYEQELLNKAANDNINLTPQQTEQLSALARGMAAAEAGARKAKEAFDFAKDATKGFLSDLRSGLANGESFWEAFGSAANNVLDKIISKIEDQLVDALFSMGAGGAGGGLGGIFGSLLGWLFPNAKGNAFEKGRVTAFAQDGVVSSPTIFPMANGAGLMGEAGPEAIMPLRRDANGRLGVAANGNGTSNIHVTVGVVVDEKGNIMPFVQSVARQEAQTAAAAGTQVAVAQANRTAPAAVAQYQRKRAGGDYRVG